MQEGLEDGELGFEGLGVAGAEGGAVGGVVVGLEAARGEGGEAWGATAVVHGDWGYVVVWMGGGVHQNWEVSGRRRIEGGR